MSKTPRKPAKDEDAVRKGRVLEALRRRAGLTQADAAERADMTPQYWGMNERGEVPGIHKPSHLRNLIAALGVSEDEFEAELRSEPSGETTGRMARIAGAIVPPPPGAPREAVFLTRDGPVIIQIPGRFTPAGFKQLENYLAIFMEANAPQDEDA